MATWREAHVTEDAALALLTEYFSSRELDFPRSAGAYRTVFPSPDRFLPPTGVFLIVEADDLAGEAADVGCGGIRRLPDPAPGVRRYEVKHLWLQPHVRGRGLGKALLAELERRALAFGATELVLDTNASLVAAGELYRSSGYAEVEPYNDNPNATHWFRKALTAE